MNLASMQMMNGYTTVLVCSPLLLTNTLCTVSGSPSSSHEDYPTVSLRMHQPKATVPTLAVPVTTQPSILRLPTSSSRLQ